MFQPLTDTDEIQEAFNHLREIFEGGEVFHRHLNLFRSPNPWRIFWHGKEEIWVHFNEYENRYLIACGTDNPTVFFSALEVICALNLPFEGVNQQCAGVFLRGPENKIYLGHSGVFPKFQKSNAEKELLGWQPVAWPDGKEAKIIVVGPIEEATLVADMAKFVHAAKKYKAKHRSSKS